MIIYPAIDIKGGKCVRLFQGNMNEVTVYSDDPIAQAKSFADAGFKWLHIVDLDGAVKGAPAVASIIRNIIKAVNIPVQVGGGIRTGGHIKSWLNAGVSRVIIGTAAVRDPDLVRKACKEYPGKIVIGIDAREGRVAIDGWTASGNVMALDLALQVAEMGAAAIIFTDIGRDGTSTGVNIEETKSLAEAVPIPVIASGGVASLDDLRAIKEAASSGIEGVIVGRALYSGAIAPQAALAL